MTAIQTMGLFLPDEFRNHWTYAKIYSINKSIHEGVSKSFRTESITKPTTNNRWEETQRIMVAKSLHCLTKQRQNCN